MACSAERVASERFEMGRCGWQVARHPRLLGPRGGFSALSQLSLLALLVQKYTY
jgi:hypothetical protein